MDILYINVIDSKRAAAKCIAGALFFSLHCSGQRSDNFIIGLTDVSPAVTAPTLWNYDVCGQYPGVVGDGAWTHESRVCWMSCVLSSHVVGDGATVYLECSSDMAPRRYLIVQIPTAGNDIMNFCEIEVYVRRKSIFTFTKEVMTASERFYSSQ